MAERYYVYESDDGKNYPVGVRGFQNVGWNPPGSGEFEGGLISVWKNRKAYGIRPRLAFLRREIPSEGRAVVTLVPVFLVSSFNSVVVGDVVPWKGENWQVVGTRVELRR